MDEINIREESFEVTSKEAITDETQNNSVSSKRRSYWEKISYYLLFALAFLLPFWIIPFGGFSLAASKSLLVYVLILASATFYLIHVLYEGKVKYLKSFAIYGLGGVVLSMLLSTLFSGAIAHSFLGVGMETGTFSFIFILSIALFLTTIFFRDEKKSLKFFFLFIISSFIVFVCQLIHLVFDTTFGGFLTSKTDTLLGGWNDFSIFFGFIALISIVLLEFFGEKFNYLRSGRKWHLSLYLVLLVAFIVMAVTNFTTNWIIFGVLISVFFVYLFSAHGKKRNFVSLPFFIILFCVFFVLANQLMGDLVAWMGLDMIDVRPSWGVTFDIAKQTLNSGAKDLFLGSGPNTFSFEWMKYKPIEINQTMFWSVGFQSGIGFLPTLIVTTGLLGSLAWLFFLGMIIFYGVKSISYVENDVTKGLLLSSFLGSVYLWIFAFVHNPGIVLLTLTFFVTGLFLAMLSRSGHLKIKEVSFINRSSVGFVFSLLVVLMLLGGITGFYFLFQKYWAIYSHNQAYIAFNEEGDLAKSEELFLRAVRFDKQDFFYRSLAELGLVKMSVVLQQQLPREEARTQFQDALSETVQYAQLATNLNPSGLLNWLMLGQVYENIISLEVEGSREAALDAYARATQVAPTDPRPYLAAARIETQAEKYDEAKQYLVAALNLKTNYTAALFLLSQITAQEGDLENAIAQTEAARLTAPNDVGVLFQLGMLYYQNEDYEDAQPVFEKVVALNPNYSNARYFLGLVYEQNGDDPSAIKQFEAIEVLNPDNEEVKKILSNLRAGRYALSNIETDPEDREEPPIEEEE